MATAAPRRQVWGEVGVRWSESGGGRVGAKGIRHLLSQRMAGEEEQVC